MKDNEAQPQTAARCLCCGAPATRQSSDGVLLCEGDYRHLAEHWRAEGFADSESLVSAP